MLLPATDEFDARIADSKRGADPDLRTWFIRSVEFDYKSLEVTALIGNVVVNGAYTIVPKEEVIDSFADKGSKDL